MLRNFLIILSTVFLYSKPALGVNHQSKIKASSSLKDVLDEISFVYSRYGSNFNSFYYSDNFSFFVVDSQNPKYLIVNKNKIVRQFRSFIKKAMDWGGEEYHELSRAKITSAVKELELILGDTEYKFYKSVETRGSETRIRSYYISPSYQLSFEESEVD